LSQVLNLTVTAVPEPTELALLLAGLASVGLLVRRRLAAPRAVRAWCYRIGGRVM